MQDDTPKSMDELEPAVPAGAEATTTPDPVEAWLSRFRQELRRGDFLGARQVLGNPGLELNPDQQHQARDNLRRLEVDVAAKVVLAVCATILVLLMALTMFP